MTKIASPFCRATIRRVVKLRPISKTLDFEKDGLARIAAEQKIGVQGVGIATGHRALSGDERLRQHLAAKHPFPAVMRRMAHETILAGRLKVEQRLNSSSRSWFQGVPDAPTI